MVFLVICGGPAMMLLRTWHIAALRLASRLGLRWRPRRSCCWRSGPEVREYSAADRESGLIRRAFIGALGGPLIASLAGLRLGDLSSRSGCCCFDGAGALAAVVAIAMRSAPSGCITTTNPSLPTIIISIAAVCAMRTCACSPPLKASQNWVRLVTSSRPSSRSAATTPVLPPSALTGEPDAATEWCPSPKIPPVLTAAAIVTSRTQFCDAFSGASRHRFACAPHGCDRDDDRRQARVVVVMHPDGAERHRDGHHGGKCPGASKQQQPIDLLKSPSLNPARLAISGPPSAPMTPAVSKPLSRSAPNIPELSGPDLQQHERRGRQRKPNRRRQPQSGDVPGPQQHHRRPAANHQKDHAQSGYFFAVLPPIVRAMFQINPQARRKLADDDRHCPATRPPAYAACQPESMRASGVRPRRP